MIGCNDPQFTLLFKTWDKLRNSADKDRPNLLSKELQHKYNVSTDVHQRWLCFNYNMGKCQDAPDGGQCNRGHHFCVRKGCHAPHPVSQHNVADKE